MPRLRLTDAAVQRLQARDGRRTDYYDATLPGFGLRVALPTGRNPRGRKTWMFYYRDAGRQVRLTLGTYPGMSLEAARREAGGLQVALTSGGDPAAARAKAARAADADVPPTFGEATKLFLAGGMPVRKGRKPSPRYAAETRRNLDNHVLPRWRDRPISAIARGDVRALVAAVAAGEVPARAVGRTAARGGPIAANRVLSAVSALFGWAVRQDMVPANPCALVEKPGEERRRVRVLSDPEVADAWAAMDALGHPFGTFMQLALLLGQRRTEVARMRWADLDMDARVWMNLTKMMRRSAVPIPVRVANLIEATPRRSASGGGTPAEFVFTTNGATPISGYSKAKRDVDALIAAARTARGDGPMPAWTIHDLRRTCATSLGRLGTQKHVISKVLDHAPRTVTDTVYDLWEYFAERRDALEAWSALVDRLVAAARPAARGRA